MMPRRQLWHNRLSPNLWCWHSSCSVFLPASCWCTCEGRGRWARVLGRHPTVRFADHREGTHQPLIERWPLFQRTLVMGFPFPCSKKTDSEGESYRGRREARKRHAREFNHCPLTWKLKWRLLQTLFGGEYWLVFIGVAVTSLPERHARIRPSLPGCALRPC